MPQSSSIFRILPLYIVIFFGFVGYSTMITLFTPLFMYDELQILPATTTIGTRVIILGVVLSLFPLAQFFGSPFLGALSDRFGRRPVLLISLAIAPICFALIATSLMIHSLYLLMLGSFLAGISQANIAIAQSAIADVSHPSDRSRLFGYIYLSASSAYVVGPLVGGKLSNSEITPWFSYATPFWLVCGLIVITFFWTQMVFRETKLHKEHSISYFAAFVNLLTIFTSKKLRVLYLVNFLMYFVIFGFFRCYPMYIVNQFHVDASKLSEFIAWVSVPIILVNLGVTGALAKRFSPKTLTMVSAFFMGIFMLTIIVPSYMNALWVTLFLTSGSLAISLPACAAMLSLSAASSEQGRVMGNNQSLQVAAEGLSAFIGGLLASIAINLSLIVLALMGFVIAGLIALLLRKRIQATR